MSVDLHAYFRKENSSINGIFFKNVPALVYHPTITMLGFTFYVFYRLDLERLSTSKLNKTIKVIRKDNPLADEGETILIGPT